MSRLEKIGFAQRQRLQYIESVVYWEGIVGRPRISRIFDVSENHITQDFAFYRRTFPGNLDYDISARTYRPGKRFRPRIGTGSADEYLSLLRTYVEGHTTAVLPAIGDGILAVGLPMPKAAMDAAILREITRALRQSHGVRIRYQSMSHDTPRERTIWPHALVFAGLRWHVRAYDSLRERFADFVLQRILSARAASEKCPSVQTNDEDWVEEEVVDVIPAPKLSQEQIKVIANEYGMEKHGDGYVWRATMKRCMVPYFLYLLRLDKNAPQASYICLADSALAERYKLGGEES